MVYVCPPCDPTEVNNFPYDEPSLVRRTMPDSINVYLHDALGGGNSIPVFYVPEDYLGRFADPDSDDEDIGHVKQILPPPPPPSPVQLAKTSAYTVDPTLGMPCIEQQTLATLSVAPGMRHDPEGITWLLPANWLNWNGITFTSEYNNKAALLSWIWPRPWQMRGLRQEFYSDPPFADNLAPTPLEIENWNIRVIRLFRRLLGITTPISNQRSLYLKAHWADERKNTTMWDTLYPGPNASPYGPCVGVNEAHCGATFLPNCNHQLPYLSQGEPCVVASGGAEGVFFVGKDWPWSIKLSRVLRNIVEAEGLTGHGGPFAGRPEVGISWKCAGGNGAVVRIKWSGALVPLPTF